MIRNEESGGPWSMKKPRQMLIIMVSRSREKVMLATVSRLRRLLRKAFFVTRRAKVIPVGDIVLDGEANSLPLSSQRFRRGREEEIGSLIRLKLEDNHTIRRIRGQECPRHTGPVQLALCPMTCCATAPSSPFLSARLT